MRFLRANLSDGLKTWIRIHLLEGTLPGFDSGLSALCWKNPMMQVVWCSSWIRKVRVQRQYPLWLRIFRLLSQEEQHQANHLYPGMTYLACESWRNCTRHATRTFPGHMAVSALKWSLRVLETLGTGIQRFTTRQIRRHVFPQENIWKQENLCSEKDVFWKE